VNHTLTCCIVSTKVSSELQRYTVEFHEYAPEDSKRRVTEASVKLEKAENNLKLITDTLQEKEKAQATLNEKYAAMQAQLQVEQRRQNHLQTKLEVSLKSKIDLDAKLSATRLDVTQLSKLLEVYSFFFSYSSCMMC